jgi:uncharacterized membrane protein
MKRFLSRDKLWVIPLCIFIVFVALSANLHPLWGDEADSALLSRSILSTGLPKIWDGQNITGFQGGQSANNKLLDVSTPWFSVYITSFFFRLFGESSIVARLPSIIISLFFIPLIYYCCIKITNSRSISFLASFISALSVQLILFSFQNHYYSFTIFSTLFLVFSSFYVLEKNKWSKYVFIISSIILIYSHYLSFVLIFLSMCFTHIVSQIHNPDIKQTKKLSLYFLTGGSLAVISFFPMAMIIYGNRGDFSIRSLSEMPMVFIITIVKILTMFNFTNVFPFVFIILIGIYLFKHKDNQSFRFLAVFLGIYILISSLLNALIATNRYTLTDLRYHTALIPFCFMLIAVYLTKLKNGNKKWFNLLVGVFLFTNLLTLKGGSFFYDFLNELKNPYKTPDIFVANYLYQNAKDNDTVFINLDRSHEPLLFFLNKKVRFINRVHPANQNIIASNRNILPEYVYNFQGPPDWIVLYSKRFDKNSFLTFDLRTVFPKGLSPNVNIERDYEKPAIIPLFFADLSRPELMYHAFYEIKPTVENQIYIYHKKSQP